MSLQFSVTARTDFASQLVTLLAGGSIKLFSGAEPANCAASDPSGLLASGTLPTPALTASSGATALTGSWSLTGSASGTAASFRAYDSGGTCHIQGAVTAAGGGGDLTVDNVVVASGQTINVLTFAITFGNA